MKRKSLINWDNTIQIFNDNINDIIGEISDNNYVDREIDTEVKKDYLDDVFKRVDNFKYKKYSKVFTKNEETLVGKKDILTKTWSNKEASIQLLVFLDDELSNYDNEDYCVKDCNDDDYDYDDGYAIIYGDSSTFLIISNYEGHPSVFTPSFTFNNTDGSTFEDNSYFDYNLNELKHFFKQKTLEYLFNQCH